MALLLLGAVLGHTSQAASLLCKLPLSVLDSAPVRWACEYVKAQSNGLFATVRRLEAAAPAHPALADMLAFVRKADAERTLRVIRVAYRSPLPISFLCSSAGLARDEVCAVLLGPLGVAPVHVTDATVNLRPRKQ